MLRYLDLAVRLLFLLAALWAVGVGVWLLVTPSGAYAVRQASSLPPEASQPTETAEPTVERLSWYEAQGPWGVAVLGIFAALYGSAAALAWKRRMLGAAAAALLALALTGLAGLSIGGLYLPAALVVIFGLLLLGAAGFTRRAGRPHLTS